MHGQAYDQAHYRFDRNLIVDGVKAQIREKFEEAEAIVQRFLEDDRLIAEVGSDHKTVWKRIGLFFENLHKYEFVDEFVEVDASRGDSALSHAVNHNGGAAVNGGGPPLSVLERGRQVAAKMRNLDKVFSGTLEGIKLAVGLAN